MADAPRDPTAALSQPPALSDAALAEIDRQAAQIIRAWHRHPAVARALTYRGVPLGMATQYHSFAPVLTALLRAQGIPVGGR